MAKPTLGCWQRGARSISTSVDVKHRRSTSAAVPNFRIAALVTSQFLARARPFDRFSIVKVTGNLRRQVSRMNCAATESYCVMFEVQVNPSDLPEIKRRAECARQICNTCLGRCQKQGCPIHSIPVWRSALCELQTPNRKVNLSPDEKYRQKTLRQQLRAITYSVVFQSTTFMRTP